MAKALRRPAWIWRMIVGIAVLCASGLAAVPAQATGINEPTLWLYDLGTCRWDRIGYSCTSDTTSSDPASLGPVRAVPTTEGTNQPLLAGHAYILCWTTTSGQSLPIGTDCASPSRVVSVPTQVPDEITATDCSLGRYLGWTLVRAFSNGQSCSLQITTPDAPELTGATTQYLFPFALAGVAIDGAVRASTTGTGRVGRAAMLQRPSCAVQQAYSGPMLSCPQVILNWAVVQGARSCQIQVQGNVGSADYMMVSVRFLRPGRCVVQGSYPEQPNRTAAYQTAPYSFTVRR